MSTYDGYFAALVAADAAQAVSVLEAALHRGESPHRLMREVVVPAQQMTGTLWSEGTWSIADEHAATGISEQALTLLAPPRRPSPRAARVVMACAEGEWHTLPARLASELSRTEAVEVEMLGGSIPAEHLQRHLRSRRPAALALSCTMPTNLLGAARSIQAAHAEGIPVIVGGAAWGPGQHRALRLGAELYVEDPCELAGALRSLAAVHPSAEGPDLPPEALLLDAVPSTLVDQVLAHHEHADPWVRHMSPSRRRQALEDLTWLARHAGAAVACDDPSIVRQLLDRSLSMASFRGVPVRVVLDACSLLADALEARAPMGTSMLRREAGLARERTGTWTDVPPGGTPTMQRLG